MRTILSVASIAILFSSCSHRVIRTGYRKPIEQAKPAPCTFVLTRTLGGHDSLRKLGSVKLKDGAFSTSCSEKDAVEILTQEACALGAHVIHITDEKRPDALSTCYRCTAIFYRDTGSVRISLSNDAYEPARLQARVEADRKSTKEHLAAYIGYTVGFMLGFGLVYMLIK